MKRTRLRFLWREQGLAREFRTGVSVHSHTMHSLESLGFIPRYAETVPPLAWEIRRQARKYKEKYDRELDYNRAFWTPPLPARQAFDLEKRSIERVFGLPALVSISDHDNIEAAAQLMTLDEGKGAPISIEWTVPYGPTYFHVGVHNLPAAEADSLVRELNRFTRGPSEGLRNELLATIANQPDTLVVLNHPLWDQGSVGAETHAALLGRLLESSGEFIHALELNGLRPWEENQRVISVAKASNRTLVSGGDRHGCEPASVVNLTGASCFSEFAADVRAGLSDLVLLLHYREPLRFRLLRSVFDIMRDYPDLPGREHWSNRVLCRRYTGEARPLSEIWNGRLPAVIRWFERFVHLLGGIEVGHMARKYAGDGDREHDYESFFHRTARAYLHGGRRTTSTTANLMPMTRTEYPWLHPPG
jgi:hypothetical protein